MKNTIQKRNRMLFVLLGCFVLFGGIVLSVMIGAKKIDLLTVVKAIFIDMGDETTSIVRDGRLPRAIAGVLVGGFLGVAGAIMQGITRNPIAEPSIMGVTQGATLMVAITFVLQKLMPDLVITSFVRMCFSFLGASISGLLVYAISSQKIKKVDTVGLVLAGTAMGTLFISLAMGVAIYFNLSQQLSFWISGGLIGVTWEAVVPLFIIGGIFIVFALILSPRITIVNLGEEVAIGLGENTNQVRLLSIIIVIVLTGISVSVAGNIVFLGLIVPQIVRRLVGVNYQNILFGSMLLGGILLSYSDTLSRVVNPPYETPIGSLTALLGVPVFIYLVRKDTK